MDAHQPNCLRTAERATSGLIVLRTAGSSLIYMNGCELLISEYCIHHTFGAESTAAPTTYGAVQGL